MFKYKFNNKKYFVKYKMKLYTQEDLQVIKINVYTITLIIKILQALLIIINVYEFKTY